MVLEGVFYAFLQLCSVTLSLNKPILSCILKETQKEMYYDKKKSGCQHLGMCCLRMLHKSLSQKRNLHSKWNLF